MTTDRNRCSCAIVKMFGPIFLFAVMIHKASPASLGKVMTSESEPTLGTKTCDLSLKQCREAYANNNTAAFERDCYIFNNLVFGSKTVKACAPVCSSKTPGDLRMCNHSAHCPDFKLAGVDCDATTTTTLTVITVNSTKSHSTSPMPTSQVTFEQSQATFEQSVSPQIKNNDIEHQGTNAALIALYIVASLIVVIVIVTVVVIIVVRLSRRDKNTNRRNIRYDGVSSVEIATDSSDTGQNNG